MRAKSEGRICSGDNELGESLEKHTWYPVHGWDCSDFKGAKQQVCVETIKNNHNGSEAVPSSEYACVVK